MRIFIDCSFIDFSRQPTGIPRVVLKYIEEGFRWSARSGIEVVPVVTSAAGVTPLRPVPGGNPPPYAQRLTASRIDLSDAQEVIAQHVNLAAYHLQAAMDAAGVAPSPVDCLQAAREVVERLTESELKKTSLRIAVEPGDILFCPAYWHDVPPAAFRAMKARGVTIVTLVHDILPVSHSKFYQAPWKYEFERNLIEAIKHSDRIYAVSRYTADSVVEFAARKGLDEIEVGVSYNGFDDLIGRKLRDRIDDPDYAPLVVRRRDYDFLRAMRPFLMVGTLEPKKGHIPTIRSFEAMWKAGLERPLVIIGRKGWMERSVIEAVEQSPYYLERLFWFDDFDDFDLYFAYRHSRGLIFSSYAEGFGIPMIEALSAGCPTVALSTPIAREILGDYGRFFANFAELAEHVHELDTDAGFDRAVAATGDFHWSPWSEIVVSLFDSLVRPNDDAPVANAAVHADGSHGSLTDRD